MSRITAFSILLILCFVNTNAQKFKLVIPDTPPISRTQSSLSLDGKAMLDKIDFTQSSSSGDYNFRLSNNGLYECNSRISLSHSGAMNECIGQNLDLRSSPESDAPPISINLNTPNRQFGVLDYLFIFGGTTLLALLVKPETELAWGLTIGVGFVGFAFLDMVLFF